VNDTEKASRLKELVTSRDLLVMPGVYDPVSAMLAEQAGFAALQCSGLAIAAVHLGVPDYSIISLGEMTEHTGRIARSVDVPVMGDGDTGFGNAVNVYFTVQAFERCGAAGVNIEDQVMPKRCGHLDGKQIIDIDEAVAKIQAAADARRNPDFVINARTDALATDGIDTVIRRGNAYLEAGATMVFVEGITSRDEIRAAVAGIDGPVAINIIEGGKSPTKLTFTELRELGVARVSLPGIVLAASVRGISDTLRQVLSDDGTWNVADRTADFATVHALSGTPLVQSLERRYLAGLATGEVAR
jgi:2-methylisocitrate lyase-like PEP mutase family enzyme